MGTCSSAPPACCGYSADVYSATVPAASELEIPKPQTELFQKQSAAPNPENRILLVSDNLPMHEQIIRSAKNNVVVVPVKYDSWDLDELRNAICLRAGEPLQDKDSIGLFDHGKKGEFCLLKSVAGGSIDMTELKDANLKKFFVFLASYLKGDDDSRIDLLACEVAAGTGIRLIEQLEELTGVNWTASTDKTGAGAEVEGGFDYVMETDSEIGDISGDYFVREQIEKWQHSATDRRMTAEWKSRFRLRHGLVFDLS